MILQYLKPIKWTRQDDILLKDLVASGNGFISIRKHFPDRSRTDCYIRHAILSGSTFEMAVSSRQQYFKSKTPYFYREEEIRLVQLRKEGKSFEEIGQVLSRNSQACYKHYIFLSSKYLKNNHLGSCKIKDDDEKLLSINNFHKENIPLIISSSPKSSPPKKVLIVLFISVFHNFIDSTKNKTNAAS